MLEGFALSIGCVATAFLYVCARDAEAIRKSLASRSSGEREVAGRLDRIETLLKEIRDAGRR